LAVEEGPLGFHARRDARRKRYRYVICDGPVRDVFRRRVALHLFRRLDVAEMKAAAKVLVGEHDFASFQSTGSRRETTVRTVFDLAIARQGAPDDHLVVFEIQANGFLYNMV